MFQDGEMEIQRMNSWEAEADSPNGGKGRQP